MIGITVCQESGVRSQESGVRSQESGVRRQEIGDGLRSLVSGLWSVVSKSLFGCLATLAWIGHDAERACQVDLVFLFLANDLLKLLGQRELAQRVGLRNALAVVRDRLILGLQVELQHLAVVVGCLD